MSKPQASFLLMRAGLRVFLCYTIAVFSLSSALSASKNPSPDSTFRPVKLAEMDAAIEQEIADKKLPGGVLHLERNNETYQKAYGYRALLPARDLMTADTIFDSASLTKVVATTPAIMLLYEKLRLDLDAPVSKYIPEFGNRGKESITVRHLLTHTSGLRAGLGRSPPWSGYEKAIALACVEEPLNPPGITFRYSDINFILLGELVRRLSGDPLNELTEREIFRPLRMSDTTFLPPADKVSRIAPTERTEKGFLRGVVHDPTARRMGGVAGHAGLFTTTADLARYSRMLLNQGTLDGVRLFKPETVQLMTSLQSPTNVAARRGLGWDIDSPYSGPRGKHFPLGSYGHTGWTGASLWIDPFSQTFLIFLSNRNHPDENGNVVALRSRLGTLAAEAVSDFNFVYVPGSLTARPSEESARTNGLGNSTANVLNGIDVLVRDKFSLLRGLRVALITNHTGTDRERTPTIDLLHNAEGVTLQALFSPEHGIRGALDDKVSDSTDTKSGLPIYSLYGETRKPTLKQLENLDALVFDIQDIGCRFYTYISTMALAMEAAAAAKLKFFVLDRVNPINGLAIDGPVLTGETSFTAFHPVPVRHGMTVGELALMFRAEKNLELNLTVVQIEGWTRDQWFDQTGLPWTNPSPNMRSVTEANLYPGVGLLEFAPLSVGRGTDTPFEVIGAPYIDDLRFAAELNQAGLKGVRFVPVRFRPRASVFKDESCAGANIILTDRDRCNVVDIGMLVTQTLHRLYPNDFPLEKFNRLLAHQATIDAIRSAQSLAEIRQSWASGLNDFRKRREEFLLYR